MKIIKIHNMTKSILALKECNNFKIKDPRLACFHQYFQLLLNCKNQINKILRGMDWVGRKETQDSPQDYTLLANWEKWIMSLMLRLLMNFLQSQWIKLFLRSRLSSRKKKVKINLILKEYKKLFKKQLRL